MIVVHTPLVKPSPVDNEFDLRFASSVAATGWERLARQVPANLRRAYDAIRAFQERLPRPAEVAAYDKGAHTRGYWNRVTPAAFGYLAGHLT